jgi:hypothetical protein
MELRPVTQRVRCLPAVFAMASVLSACAHVGRPHDLTPTDQVVASALSWALRVPPRASEYRVELPPSISTDAALNAVAADTRLKRRGSTLRSVHSGGSRDPVRITVHTPQTVAPRDIRVPFTVAVGNEEPTRCVVRINRKSDDPRTWAYASEGQERCWPRPGSWSTP